MAGKFQDADAFVNSMLGNLEAYHNDPEGFEAQHDERREARLKNMVEKRDRVPQVTIPGSIVERLGGQPTPEEAAKDTAHQSVDLGDSPSAEQSAEAPKSEPQPPRPA